MNRVCVPVAALVIMSLMDGESAQCAGGRSASRGVEETIKAVLAADDPLSAAEAFHDLFALAGANGLGGLRKSPHDSIALQAAWEEVALTVPKTADQAALPLRPDRRKLTWFVGFLAGRTRLRVPKWWSEAILDARAYRRGNIFFGDTRFEKPVKTVTSEMVSIKNGDVAVAKKGNVFSVRVAGDSIVLPTELVASVRDPECHCGVCFTSTACYVADYKCNGHSFTLACLDRASGKTVWKTSVWGSSWGSSGGSGCVTGRAAVELHEDRVVVFGCMPTGIHVEAFRADNGKNLFRFSNGYSWAD